MAGRPWPVGVAGDPWPVAGVAGGRDRAWPVAGDRWPWPVAGVAGGRCRWPATKNDYSAHIGSHSHIGHLLYRAHGLCVKIKIYMQAFWTPYK